MSDQLRHRVLIILGDGGTTDMADRVIHWLATEHVPGVRPEDILGLSEVAGMIGRSKQLVCNWMAQPAKLFPAPIVELAATKIWHREQVQTWMDAHHDLLGD